MAITHRPIASASAGSLVLVALVLGACATGAAPSTSDSVSPRASRPARSAPPVETVPAEPSRAIGEVPEELVEAILADAEARSEVRADQIVVLTAEMITWPDGSLGCPEPDMVYTQALVDGYQVVLDAGGTQLDYRVGEGGNFRLCEAGGRPTDP